MKDFNTLKLWPPVIQHQQNENINVKYLPNTIPAKYLYKYSLDNVISEFWGENVNDIIAFLKIFSAIENQYFSSHMIQVAVKSNKKGISFSIIFSRRAFSCI